MTFLFCLSVRHCWTLIMSKLIFRCYLMLTGIRIISRGSRSLKLVTPAPPKMQCNLLLPGGSMMLKPACLNFAMMQAST